MFVFLSSFSLRCFPSALPASLQIKPDRYFEGERQPGGFKCMLLGSMCDASCEGETKSASQNEDKTVLQGIVNVVRSPRVATVLRAVLGQVFINCGRQPC